MNYAMNNPYEIAKFIKNATKSTPVKVYIQGKLSNTTVQGIKFFGQGESWTIFGESDIVLSYLNNNKKDISDFVLENNIRNSAIPLLDLKKINARIEPGAIIRDKVSIGENSVIMMGAVINIASNIGSKTMIDMNAVLGARARVGNNVHIGAGAVLAGVLEPPSATPVIVEDNVLIGANAVILEGVKIGKGAVVAAGAIVTSDVKENTVVAGTPAKFIKFRDEKTNKKTELLKDLRG